MPEFDPTLSPDERKLIEEELAILVGVSRQLAEPGPPGNGEQQGQNLLELRDLLEEASADEIPQIVAQMDSLAALSTQLRSHPAEEARRFASPYFGHLRIAQEGRLMDVLIGDGTHISRDAAYPIIDWRNAPISRLYYFYQEGDEYEEEFGGKRVEGKILVHRRIMIVGGRLMQVQQSGATFRLTRERWSKLAEEPPRLRGGEGSAIRPATVEPLQLGVAHAGLPLEDKYLRPVTALISPEQFDLITRPDSGIVVVEGGAGSGKTTIALHRIAYLAYRAPERFGPAAILAVIFNKALAGYVSRLLPALGATGVRIEVFEDFAFSLRRRHFSELPGAYCETTPFTVVRFKQHPIALVLLEAHAARLAAEFRRTIVAELEEMPSLEKVLGAWDGLMEGPMALGLAELSRWVRGKLSLPGVGSFGSDWLAARRLKTIIADLLPDPTRPASLAVTVWEEAFLNLEHLRETAERLAPGQFTLHQLTEVRNWSLEAHGLRQEHEEWRAEGRETEREGSDEAAPEYPRFDREDDTLLLLLHRKLVAPLRNRKKRPLRFAHLMIDEAQDFGPLELRLLLDLVAEPASITIAGDTDQRTILYSAFPDWDGMLDYLGLAGTKISPLQVGYRSTEEIMQFSRAVLGPLASDRPWLATRSGAPVVLLRFTDTGQAVALLSQALAELMRSEPTANVALIARHPEQAEEYFQGLAKTDLPQLRRVAEQDFSFQPGVEVTDTLQVKGLEFDYVILVDVDSFTYPEDAPSRHLLHVAATRAAHQLWLVASRPPSPLIPADVPTRFF